jgi:hypothetical protein
MSERWLWTQKEDIGPSPRWGAAMAYEVARQRVVLYGGTYTNVGTGFNDTWEWDGSAWTQVADMGPSGRWLSGMACDDSRQRLVLFGGAVRGTQGYQAHGDTWEWNGTEWTQVADIGPPPRMGYALTYDTVRQRVVLYGGYDANAKKYLDDTWEWDGTEWTQIADTGPPARSNHEMVFDRERGVLVLFGGWAPGAPAGWLGDTWDWDDDAGWVKRQDMGPRSMANPKMVYTGEHTVLVGAPAQGGAAVHTWEWNGRLWTQRQDMGPSYRYAYVLGYDGQRDRVVLFGGYTSGPQPTPLGDTWELAIIEQ